MVLAVPHTRGGRERGSGTRLSGKHGESSSIVESIERRRLLGGEVKKVKRTDRLKLL